MRAAPRATDPFTMLIDPQAFLSAIEASPRLKAMNGRICRPLDRPAVRKGVVNEQAAFDASVEQEISNEQADELKDD